MSDEETPDEQDNKPEPPSKDGQPVDRLVVVAGKIERTANELADLVEQLRKTFDPPKEDK